MSDEIKVTGTPVTYGDGAIRNTKDGKGRFDLIPPEPLSVIKDTRDDIMNSDLFEDESGHFCFKIGLMDVYERGMQISYAMNHNTPETQLSVIAEAIISIVLYSDYPKSMEYTDLTEFYDDFNDNMMDMMLQLAKHFENGAKIYGERNCEKGIPKWSFLDSGLRHLTQYLYGVKDENHYISSIWNFWMLMWTIQKENNLAFKELEDLRKKIDKFLCVGGMEDLPIIGQHMPEDETDAVKETDDNE